MLYMYYFPLDNHNYHSLRILPVCYTHFPEILPMYYSYFEVTECTD